MREDPKAPTRSMVRQAKQMGITTQEYWEHWVTRNKEIENKPRTYRRNSPKVHTISADNPVLIIGGGPSWNRNAEEIKKFPGIILASEAIFNDAVRLGIKPDYIVTMEVNAYKPVEAIFNEGLLEQLEKKPKFVMGPVSNQRIINTILGNSAERIVYIPEDMPRITNAGLFGIVYSYYKLKADKIFLVGFEHEGTIWPQHDYDVWQVDFWHFVRMMPDRTIVNCTGGGRLYDTNIIDCPLKRLKWAKT